MNRIPLSTISATTDPGMREAAATRLEYDGIEYARLPVGYSVALLMLYSNVIRHLSVLGLVGGFRD
jgi:hypothetical protein